MRKRGVRGGRRGGGVRGRMVDRLRGGGVVGRMVCCQNDVTLDFAQTIKDTPYHAPSNFAHAQGSDN